MRRLRNTSSPVIVGVDAPNIGGDNNAMTKQIQFEQQKTEAVKSGSTPWRPIVFPSETPQRYSFLDHVWTYTLTITIVLVLATISYRVFYIDYTEKNTMDIILTYAVYLALIMLVCSVVALSIGWLISFIRKRWYYSNIYILPNGLPITFKDVLNRSTLDAALTKLGYYDVEHVRAGNPIVAPAELHVSMDEGARSMTYAPSNVREDRIGDDHSQSENLQLLNSSLGADENDRKEEKLPTQINLFDVLDRREPNKVILGQTEDMELLQVPIDQLFHHQVTGQSGSGKSVYLRGMVYQLMEEAKSQQIWIGLADIEGNTFAEFRGKEHIKWFASNFTEIESLTTTLLKELESRKTLYETMPGGTPKDLTRYNILARRVDRPALSTIVVVFDEFSAFMHRTQAEHKRILADLYQLVLRARKYGIFIILAGHSFKADLIDSTVMGQFSFNLCFRVRTLHQSIAAIGVAGADKLINSGEALVKTKQGDILHIQTLFVDDDTLMDALDGFGSENSGIVPDLVQKIISFSRDSLESKLLIKELERHFRDKGYHRGDVIRALEWMDDHGFVVRNERNGRVLHNEVIEKYIHK